MTTIPRRTFVKAILTVLHGMAALILGVPGLRFLLDPLRKRSQESDFIRIGPLSLVSLGRPVRVTVSADRWDAYTHHPPGPIGTVWLIREGESEDHPEIRCLQTVCPHLGCGIDYVSDRHGFACPCHASDFELSGRRREGPSPRDLDRLACRVTEPDEQGRRWIEVRYQEFQTGIASMQAIA